MKESTKLKFAAILSLIFPASVLAMISFLGIWFIIDFGIMPFIYFESYWTIMLTLFLDSFLIISISYLVAGTGTLFGFQWGRKLLSYTAVAQIVTGIIPIATYFIMTLFIYKMDAGEGAFIYMIGIPVFILILISVAILKLIKLPKVKNQ